MTGLWIRVLDCIDSALDSAARGNAREAQIKLQMAADVAGRIVASPVPSNPDKVAKLTEFPRLRVAKKAAELRVAPSKPTNGHAKIEDF